MLLRRLRQPVSLAAQSSWLPPAQGAFHLPRRSFIVRKIPERAPGRRVNDRGPSLEKDLFPESHKAPIKENWREDVVWKGPVPRTAPHHPHTKKVNLKTHERLIVAEKNGTQPEKSLFEELFPEDSKDGLAENARLASGQEGPLIPRPAQEFDTYESEDLESSPDEATERPSTVRYSDVKAVLILYSASKSLVETDFYRLGESGTIDGWVSGIIQVIQGRQSYNLEPTGIYYVLFNNRAAALAYHYKVQHLWRMAKDFVPGARVNEGSEYRPFPPPGLHLRDGRDVHYEIKKFTLVEPSQRYSMKLFDQITPEKVEQLFGKVCFVDRIADKAGSRNLVHVAVEGGRITADTLKQAIHRDGVERNLPWQVLDRNFKKGFLPFGRSSLATAEDIRYSNFILAFKDMDEARRFARSWNRQNLHIEIDRSQSDVPEVRAKYIVNTSILW